SRGLRSPSVILVKPNRARIFLPFAVVDTDAPFDMRVVPADWSTHTSSVLKEKQGTVLQSDQDRQMTAKLQLAGSRTASARSTNARASASAIRPRSGGLEMGPDRMLRRPATTSTTEALLLTSQSGRTFKSVFGHIRL